MNEDAEERESTLIATGEDYYYEGDSLVFTEAYHLKRGYCCASGCRHCPWREQESSRSDV